MKDDHADVQSPVDRPGGAADSASPVVASDRPASARDETGQAVSLQQLRGSPENATDGQDVLSLHRCKVCGTAWLLWPDVIHGGGWNLLDKYQRPGACCDNAAMGDQIEHLRDIPLAAAPVPCAASPADPWQPIETAPKDGRIDVNGVSASSEGAPVAVSLDPHRLLGETIANEFEKSEQECRETLAQINKRIGTGIEFDGDASTATHYRWLVDHYGSRARAVRDLLARLRGEATVRQCVWTFSSDDFADLWETACGETWQFIDGGLVENKARFCHGCGGQIVPVITATVRVEE